MLVINILISIILHLVCQVLNAFLACHSTLVSEMVLHSYVVPAIWTPLSLICCRNLKKKNMKWFKKENLPSSQCWPQLQWASLWRVFWGLVWGLAMANRINYCAKGQKPFQFSKYHKALISIQQNVKVSGDLKYQTNLLEDYFLAHMCEQFCQRQLFWSKVHAFPESCKILLKFTKLNCSWEGVQKNLNTNL